MRPATLTRLRTAIALVPPTGIVAVFTMLVIARWPAYWQWVAPEQTPMTFVQATLLLVAGLGAALSALLAALAGASRRDVSTWLVLASGFVALALDERFALHERLRDGLLADAGVALPWGAPGDYVLLVYATAGLLLLPGIWRLLAGDHLARAVFAAAIVLAVAAVVADSFDIERVSLAAQRTAQSAEELIEGVADALFAAALWLHAVDRVAMLASAGEPSDTRGVGSPPAEPVERPGSRWARRVAAR